MDNKFGTGRVLQNITRMKSDLPRLLANQAQRFFLARFTESNWDDGVKQPWDVPKRRDPETSEYKYPKAKGLGRRTRATLVQSGALRRAVGMSVKHVSFEQIVFLVPLKYAAIHNEGGPAKAWGKHSFTMPRRRFMGDSATLRTQQIKLIKDHLDRLWTN